jgi:hypothetical protein
MIMFFTGNNIKAGGDLSSRNLTIRLDTNRTDPENRAVEHSDPIGWTETNRGEVLKALYTVLLGNPRLRGKPNSKPETRFKSWWELVGSAVEHAAAQMGETLRFRDVFTVQEEDSETEELFDVLEVMWCRWPLEFAVDDVAEIFVWKEEKENDERE